MKKAILSPVCSALVIPGLGQVINQHLRKGLLMLAGIFILLVLFTVQLYGLVRAVMNSRAIETGDPAAIMNEMMNQDLSGLYVLLAAFCALWIYSVIDAFLGGIKADKLDEGV